MLKTIRISMVAVLAALLAMPAGVASAGERAVRSSHPMRWGMDHPDAGAQVNGVFRTRATREGTSAVVITDGLEPGHSYTLWLTFINNPVRCVEQPNPEFRCGMFDVMANPAADASTVLIGGIASARGQRDRLRGWMPADSMPENHWEVAEYAIWRARNNHFPVEGFFDEQHSTGTGVLTNPRGAEYHVTVRDHGPYNPGKYGDTQRTTHDGGCHVGDDYTCGHPQAAGFMTGPSTYHKVGPVPLTEIR